MAKAFKARCPKPSLLGSHRLSVRYMGGWVEFSKLLPSKDFRKISTTQFVAQPSDLWVHPFPLIRSKLTRGLELTCRLR